MLIVNGKKLAHLEKNDPFLKHYKGAVNLLKKKFGKTVIVNYPDDVGMKARLSSGAEITEYPAGFSFHASRVYTWIEGDYEIQYATNSKPDKNGTISYYPKMIDFKEMTHLDLNRQADLAFFYIFVCPMCLVFEDKELKKFQNDRRKRVFFEVYDIAGRAQKELATESKVAEAKAMITGGRFAIPYETVVSISIVYGFGDVKNLTPDENIVRKALLDFVTSTNSKGKYNMELVDQFIADVNYPELIEIKALIKQMASAGIVGLERDKKVLKYFVYDDGKKTSELCTVNQYAEPEKSLIAYLQNHPDDLANLKEVFERAS